MVKEELNLLLELIMHKQQQGGYDASTLDPKSVTIIDGTDTYAFTISAKGTLTLHVTDTQEASTGVQIIGAKFIRTDSTGTIVGKEITTNDDGNAVFENVPYAQTGSNTIYYKQISGDGGHTFDDTVKSITMTQEMDVNFPNIPVIDGQIILDDN